MSQSAAILRHLKRGGLLTARSAYRLYGTMRLAARIKELRDRGYGIQTTMLRVRSAHIAVYRL
jgi:hypothetical protein